MSKSYQPSDREMFDYDLVRIEGTGWDAFRGPAIDATERHAVCVGAAQTFGRYCHRPFPALLSDRLGLPVRNLGVGGAGYGRFDHPGFLDHIGRASLVVVQVMSGLSQGNSLFQTDRGGRLGTRLSDGEKMRSDAFFKQLWTTESLARRELVVAETRARYVSSATRLLEGIRAPCVLLWISVRSPDTEDDFSEWKLVANGFPHLVNRSMVDAIRPHADAYVEYVSTRGLPQRLWPTDTKMDGAILVDGVLYNRYYPSPQMHEEVAERLAPVCRELLDHQAATEQDA